MLDGRQSAAGSPDIAARGGGLDEGEHEVVRRRRGDLIRENTAGGDIGRAGTAVQQARERAPDDFGKIQSGESRSDAIGQIDGMAGAARAIRAQIRPDLLRSGRISDIGDRRAVGIAEAVRERWREGAIAARDQDHERTSGRLRRNGAGGRRAGRSCDAGVNADCNGHTASPVVLTKPVAFHTYA